MTVSTGFGKTPRNSKRGAASKVVARNERSTDMLLQRQHADLTKTLEHGGVSENSVPLNPMVNDHYPY